MSCFRSCEIQALNPENPTLVEREICNLCFECTEACPSGALSRVGEHRSIDEVLAIIESDQPFFEASGGGVTLSGGEATIHMEYAGSLAKKIHSKGIHVLLETCGAFSMQRFDELLYPHLDLIYFDIKVFDTERHRELCGTDNDVILNNFAELHRRTEGGGIEVVPRIPLVPTLTATEDNLTAIAGFLRELGVRRVGLLPYNPLWHDKVLQLSPTADPPSVDALKRFMNPEHLASCRQTFDGFDLLKPC
jgi:pyruvate formate lyase activating enzyme